LDTTVALPSASIRRLAYGLLSLALVGLIVYELALNGGGWWQLAAFGLGPDLALVLGAGRGLARGQLHPRAVLLYNALHRFWGPVGLLVVVLAAGLQVGYLVGALAWALHIAVDRTVGYGLRTPDGLQRA
jgi:hypothetical protein